MQSKENIASNREEGTGYLGLRAGTGGAPGALAVGETIGVARLLPGQGRVPVAGCARLARDRER